MTERTRILIVEDEMLIATDIEEKLIARDWAVAGLAGSEAAALAMLNQSGIDAAILDRNLGRSTSAGVAHALKNRTIPFLFVSGDGRSGFDSEFADVPVLSKPINFDELAAALTEMTTSQASN